ncbi:hypothetical protein BC827DRAFT_646536 [Russula dissimulans]|nr:hypothetical protein BC827DRAFT_646536 [Russula dissimulans]
MVLSRFTGCVPVLHSFLSVHRAVESIDETSRKKKQLNEAEIALRREETAHKREHLSKKKLEDEKAETINHLKKKTAKRNRRNQLASVEGRTPATHPGNGKPAEGKVDEEESTEVAVVPVVEVAPTCYLWVSTLKSSPDAPPGDKTFHSSSVPTLLLPVPHQPTLDGDGDTIMVGQEQQQQSRNHGPRPSVIWTDARQ